MQSPGFGVFFVPEFADKRPNRSMTESVPLGASIPTQLHALVESTVESLGYEAVGVEFGAGGSGGQVLRVYIDQAQGIRLEDCELVSRQLSAVLDVEDPIGGHYDLEVSSPGLDRPLFKAEHFSRFAGARVKLRLARRQGERRRYTGRLLGIEGDEVLVELDDPGPDAEQGDEPLRFRLEDIETARLVPEF